MRAATRQMRAARPYVGPPKPTLERRYALAAADCLPLTESHGDADGLARICEFILFALNRDRSFGYVKKLGLSGPTADIYDIVGGHGEDGRVRPQIFLKLFRTGNFGPALLDDISTPYKPMVFRDWGRIGGRLGERMDEYLREGRERRASRGHVDGDDGADGESESPRLAHVAAARSEDFHHKAPRKKRKRRRLDAWVGDDDGIFGDDPLNGLDNVNDWR